MRDSSNQHRVDCRGVFSELMGRKMVKVEGLGVGVDQG